MRCCSPVSSDSSPHALPNGARDEFLLAATAQNSGALSASWSRPVVGEVAFTQTSGPELNCWSPLTTANRDSYGPAQARFDDSGSAFGGCTPPQPPTVDPPTAPPRRVFCCPTPRPRPKAALPKRKQGRIEGASVRPRRQDRILEAHEFYRLDALYCTLDAAGRRRRFGAGVSDASIRSHCETLREQEASVIVAFESNRWMLRSNSGHSCPRGSRRRSQWWLDAMPTRRSKR